MLLDGKVVRLDQLQGELVAAGIAVPALGQDGDDLHTYDGAGAYRDLPAAAAPVVAAHVPQPTDQEQDVSSRAALVQTAQTAYQALQADIAGWAGMTTAQRQAATLRAMQALATTMQVVAVVARIMQRQGS